MINLKAASGAASPCRRHCSRADEKVAQNVAAGVAGLVVWPLWFAMDFKGAADKDVVALEARQQYLTSLAVERCRPPRRG